MDKIKLKIIYFFISECLFKNEHYFVKGQNDLYSNNRWIYFVNIIKWAYFQQKM
jgi:hypothetical protein